MCRIVPFGLAIVGSSGHAARVAAPTVAAAAGARLVGVLGSEPTRSAALAGSYDRCRAYAGWDELAADDDVDAVWIAAGPNARHVEYATRCLDAGKHVLLEKPMATTRASADALAARAAGSRLVFVVAFQQRFRIGHLWIRDAIRRGAVGDVRLVRIQRFVRFPYFAEMPDDVGLSWRSSRGDSGGWATNDIGSHLVDLATWYLGEPTALSLARTYRLRFREIDAEDTAVLVLEAASGARAVVHVSTALASFPSTTEVHGLGGWIRADDTFDSGGRATTSAGDSVEFPHSSNADVYAVQLDDFLGALAGEPSHGATAAEGAANAATIEAAAASIPAVAA